MYKPVHNKDDYKHSYFNQLGTEECYPFVVLMTPRFYRQERWSVNCADARSISDLHKFIIWTRTIDNIIAARQKPCFSQINILSLSVLTLTSGVSLSIPTCRHSKMYFLLSECDTSIGVKFRVRVRDRVSVGMETCRKGDMSEWRDAPNQCVQTLIILKYCHR